MKLTTSFSAASLLARLRIALSVALIGVLVACWRRTVRGYSGLGRACRGRRVGAGADHWFRQHLR